MNKDRLSLDSLRAEIKEKNAKWKAGRTCVSELSVEERRERLGFIPTTKQLAQISKLGLDTELTSLSFVQSLQVGPGASGGIDWRSSNGANWITPVKDQGGCGSCVAFGTNAALESLLKIRFYNNASKDLDFSEAHLLWCGGGSCNGWHMDDACDYLMNNGVPDEVCFPYKDRRMSCRDTCSDWQKWVGETKILGWTNTKDVSVMKENLANNGPQITGMAVYEDFFSYESGVYRHVTGALLGYHCVCVVGYDDSEGCWICKNSWGTGWGESGFFRISYGECGISDVFGMWNMRVKTPEEVEEGYADQISIEYSWTSSARVLHAYAGGNWRHVQISDEDLLGIAKIAIEASKVYVGWKDDQLTFIKCYK